MERRDKFVLVALTCAAILLTGSALLEAKPARDPVSGEASVSGKVPTMTGTGTMVIRGQEAKIRITTMLLGPPRVSDDGTEHAKTTHKIEILDEDGDVARTIITEDAAVSEPIGVSPDDGFMEYKLNANMKVVEGGTGRLHAHGILRMRVVSPTDIDVEASYRINGVIGD